MQTQNAIVFKVFRCFSCRSLIRKNRFNEFADECRACHGERMTDPTLRDVCGCSQCKDTQAGFLAQEQSNPMGSPSVS